MKTFKKTFILICDECGKFAHTKMEYCENCGAQAIRKATKEDYKRYERETISREKERKDLFEKTEKTRMVADRAEMKVEKAAKKAEGRAEKARIANEKVENAKKRDE